MWREAGRVLEGAWRWLVLEGLRAGCRAALIVRPLPRIEGKPPPPRSVIVFSTAGIGDTLSDTPAIRALRESFPACRITAAVHHRRQEVLAENPHIDRLVPHRKSPAGFLRTLRALRQARPDTVVVLRANDPDVWPLAYLSGARCLVGRPANTRFGFLINRPAAVPEWERLHGVQQTLAIVRAIGADTADPRMDYAVPETARRAVAALLRERGLDGARMVAMQVHRSPRLSFRDWPVEHFIALGRQIVKAYPIRLAVTGGREDAAAAEAVAKGLGTAAASFAGELSLPETAALLTRCRMLLTTDTGIMHLGFAVRVPTLALLHPYNAHRVCPHGYGRLHRVLVLPRVRGRGEPSLRLGMEGLAPEEVFRVFQQFWEESGGATGVEPGGPSALARGYHDLQPGPPGAAGGG